METYQRVRTIARTILVNTLIVSLALKVVVLLISVALWVLS